MTLDEAQLIANVCSHADRGCRNCVRELAALLNKTLPQFDFLMDGSQIEERPFEDDPSYVTHYPRIRVTVRK